MGQETLDIIANGKENFNNIDRFIKENEKLGDLLFLNDIDIHYNENNEIDLKEEKGLQLDREMN